MLMARNDVVVVVVVLRKLECCGVGVGVGAFVGVGVGGPVWLSVNGISPSPLLSRYVLYRLIKEVVRYCVVVVGGLGVDVNPLSTPRKRIPCLYCILSSFVFFYVLQDSVAFKCTHKKEFFFLVYS